MHWYLSGSRHMTLRKHNAAPITPTMNTRSQLWRPRLLLWNRDQLHQYPMTLGWIVSREPMVHITTAHPFLIIMTSHHSDWRRWSRKRNITRHKCRMISILFTHSSPKLTVMDWNSLIVSKVMHDFHLFWFSGTQFLLLWESNIHCYTFNSTMCNLVSYQSP